jgi:tRNA 5-methylaminomethyl-2-thiouridine biosynthesis bifunctional protein
MHAMLMRLGLPPDYVQAVDARAAEGLSGIAVPSPAWFYPAGGWVEPGGLARSFIERAGSATSVQHGADVQAIRRVADRWEALDGAGRVMAASDAPAAAARLPIAGTGYLLPPLDGHIIFGATSSPGDPDPAVRAADHRFNLAQLTRLIGRPLPLEPSQLQGRTAWRCAASDRLPIVGAVPALDPQACRGAARRDQVRFAAREPGLFVCTALGSRGITWSALCAEVLAAAIGSSAMPLEASLLDAIDPARFAVRAWRSAGRARAG